MSRAPISLDAKESRVSQGNQNLYFIHVPTGQLTPPRPIEFLSAQEFLEDEQSCRAMWQMISDYFRTRSKFLSIWPSVSYVAIYKDRFSSLGGLLLVSEFVNWQIDYVVVDEAHRGEGVARSLVIETTSRAFRKSVPYVMLTSSPELRPLYESCGFVAVASEAGANECGSEQLKCVEN